MLREQELDEKLASLTEEDIQNLKGDELEELEEYLAGDDEHEEPEPAQLNVHISDGETKEEAVAKLAIKPEFHAAATLLQIDDSHIGNVDLEINALIGELEKQTEMMRKQDLSTADAMLASQAHMLDMLFYRLVRRSDANSNGGFLEAAGSYMKLAMRAQSQCRMTWETAAKIKNPPVIVKQQNVAHNQQVNNGGETENPPNELSEVSHELLPDKRNAGAAIPINPRAQAVGALDRTKVGAG